MNDIEKAKKKLQVANTLRKVCKVLFFVGLGATIILSLFIGVEILNSFTLSRYGIEKSYFLWIFDVRSCLYMSNCIMIICLIFWWIFARRTVNLEDLVFYIEEKENELQRS